MRASLERYIFTVEFNELYICNCVKLYLFILKDPCNAQTYFQFEISCVDWQARLDQKCQLPVIVIVSVISFDTDTVRLKVKKNKTTSLCGISFFKIKHNAEENPLHMPETKMIKWCSLNHHEVIH